MIVYVINLRGDTEAKSFKKYFGFNIMNESEHPAIRFAAPLMDLAEGRTEPSDWMA